MPFDAATLVPGVIFGCIGMAYFSHGKKLSRPLHMLSGLGLFVLPLLIESPVPQLATCSALVLLPFITRWL